MRIGISDKVSVSLGTQVLALGLDRYRGKIFFSPRTRRIVGEFALEAGD
jgi:hypothetical protein